jgi:hypothetical protein
VSLPCPPVLRATQLPTLRPPHPVPNPCQIFHSTDPAAIATAAAAPLPPAHRLCGFPDSPPAAAGAAADEPPAAAAGRDVDAADEALGYPPSPPAACGAGGVPAALGLALLKRAGGRLQWLTAGTARLGLRLLLDHSLVEVFTSTGEVLSSRVYRGDTADPAPVAPGTAAPACNGAVELLAWGGCRPAAAAAYEMNSIWRPEEDRAAAAATTEAEAAAAPVSPVPGPARPRKALVGASCGSSGAAPESDGAREEEDERRLQERELLAAGAAAAAGPARAAGGTPLPPAAMWSPPRAPRIARGVAAAPRLPRAVRATPPPALPRAPRARGGGPGVAPGLALRAAAKAALAGACRWDACCAEGVGCGCGGRTSPAQLPSPRAGGGERDSWDDM